MERDIVFTEISAFIHALQDEGITKVIFAEINEKRALPQGEDSLIVSHVHSIDILAYKNSTIFKYTAADEQCTSGEAALCAAGFEIARRNRNLV